MALWTITLLWPLQVSAHLADNLGLGSRSIALGGANTALAHDFSSLYYNPAGLSDEDESSLTLGGIWAKPWLEYQEEGLPPVRPHLYATGGGFLGVSTNLGHLTGYDQLSPWTFGICLYLPVERLLLAVIPNRNSDKEFIFYLDQTEVTVLMAGLSWKITDWLSIGASGNFLVDLRAPNEGFVDVDTRTLLPYLAGTADLVKDVRPRVMRDVEIKASPIIGILLKPAPWLRVGASYKGKAYTETVGTQDIVLRFRDFSGASSLSYEVTVLGTIHYVHSWTPHQIRTGVAVLPTASFRIALDLTWADWSDYLDPMWYVPEQRFHDTWTPRLGLEYELSGGVSLRTGYSFQPSPVPEQTSASNYLDNDKHVISLGFGYTFTQLPWVPIWKKPLTVDSFFQYAHLVPRPYRKAPVYGSSLEMNGYMIHCGLSLTLHY